MARQILNKPVKAPRAKLIKRPVVFEWRGPFENWSRAFVNRNFWRVRELFGSEEDAVQECALIFVRCCNTYYGKVDNPRWMMSLFKRAVSNDWHTFSQRDTNIRSLPIPNEEETYDYNNGELLSAVEHASQETRTVIHALINAPNELLSLVLIDQDPVKLNRRMKRFFGISKSTRDIVMELRELLTR